MKKDDRTRTMAGRAEIRREIYAEMTDEEIRQGIEEPRSPWVGEYRAEAARRGIEVTP